MPAAPLREYFVAFVFVGRFPVLGFWLAADFADSQRRKNYSAKETVRVGGLTGNIGEYRPGLWVSQPCAMSL